MNRFRRNLQELWRAIVMLLTMPVFPDHDQLEAWESDAQRKMEAVYNTPENITSDGLE